MAFDHYSKVKMARRKEAKNDRLGAMESLYVGASPVDPRETEGELSPKLSFDTGGDGTSGDDDTSGTKEGIKDGKADEGRGNGAKEGGGDIDWVGIQVKTSAVEFSWALQ